MIKRIAFLITALTITLHAYAQSDSLDIKIGQMLLVGVNGQAADSIILQNIHDGKVGGVVIYEKNFTKNNTYINLKNFTWSLQKASETPLFITIDQEGGVINRLKTKYQFPKSVTAAYLGKQDNIDSTFFYGEITAATLSGLGINVNFAPVVDLAINPENPIIAKHQRAFSDSAEMVAKHAAITVASHRKHHVITVLKHFPGHGSSKSDTHLGIADVTPYWQQKELYPYQEMIKNNEVDAIMTAHIVNKQLDSTGLPGTLSKPIMTGILRDNLKYEGVIFSDDMQMHAITKHYGLEKSVLLSIKAGVDVLMFSNNIQGSKNRTVDTVFGIIRKYVEDGILSEERISASYERIMKLKSQLK